MRYFYSIILLFFFGNVVNAQFFKKSDNGFQLFSDSSLTTKVSDEVYERCWCNPVYKNDSLLFYQPKFNPRNFISVKKHGKWGAINKSGDQVKPFEFDHPFVQNKSGHYLVFADLRDTNNEVSYKIGSQIIRLDSTLKVDTTYYIMDDYKGSYLVSSNKIVFGIVNGDFKFLLPMKYESVHYRMINFRFNKSGLLPMQNDLDKCGIVNYQGKIIVPFTYDWMNDYIFNEKFIYVQLGKKRGFINSSNQTVVPLRYETCPQILGPKNLVADENYTWFVNEKFEAISPKYQALQLEGNLYFFKQNYKWGVMDTSMNIIVPNQYSSIEYGPRLKTDPDFRCYYAVKNGKYGMITLKNEIIIPFEYECICNVSYYAQDNYYIEFKKGNTLYRFDHKGTLIEKVVGEGRACICEMQTAP